VQFGKTYSSMDEFASKFNNFQVNAANIASLNADNDADAGTFGHTQFSDMHPNDFRSQYLSTGPSADELAIAAKGGFYSSKGNPDPTAASGKNLRNLQTVPASWDWRISGAVNPVKNQLQCGACWSFAATSLVESLYFIKYGSLHNLSEQQLMDCSYANSACVGGTIANALVYIEGTYGLETTYNYGNYLAYQSYCRSSSSLGLAEVSGYVFLGSNEAYIMTYLYNYGPVAVTINATPLQVYSSGIINLSASGCNPTYLDHAVLIVGYGTSNGLPYWIVRNSWGPYWGEAGYFRIVRGYGVCGINSYTVSAYIA